jgi:effector-binding domain-containing protein
MMKKVLIILVLAAAAVFCLIPSKIKFNYEITFEASDAVTAKFLTYKNNWNKWWPGTQINDRHYRYNDIDFNIIELTNSGAVLTLQKGKLKLNCTINYLSTNEGEVKITWDVTNKNGAGSLPPVIDKFKLPGIKNQIEAISKHLKLFLENEKNAYGYKIYLKAAKDTVLLTSTTLLNTYPSIPHVYNIINDLKQQAAAKGVKETNYPIMNVTKINEQQYQLSVAIPINKSVSPSSKTAINNIPRGGNLLVADVQGGTNTVKEALAQIKIYMKDHRLISPAMPFESLITDRCAEKDTSKWITKIYYPIF